MSEHEAFGAGWAAAIRKPIDERDAAHLAMSQELAWTDFCQARSDRNRDSGGVTQARDAEVEIARLRGALEPFARACEYWTKGLEARPKGVGAAVGPSVFVCAGDFQRAHAALQASQRGEGE